MKSVRLRVCLLIFSEDSVLLIKHRKKDRQYWLVPGGGVEFGETVEQALKREMKEECGLEVEVGPLALTCETIGGENRHIVHMFFKGSISSGKLRLGDEDNLTDLKFIPLSELAGITVYPKVTDKIIAISRGAASAHHVFGNIWED